MGNNEHTPIKKSDYKTTLTTAKKFKRQLDAGILAELNNGVNLVPFESELHITGNKISLLLSRFISTLEE